MRSAPSRLVRLRAPTPMSTARRLIPLVNEGFATTLTEAAIRSALSPPRWARSWSVWRRRNSPRTHSLRSKKAPYRELRSTGCQHWTGFLGRTTMIAECVGSWI